MRAGTGWRMAVFAMACGAGIRSAGAHDGVAGRIHDLGHAIAKSPRDADLWIRRGRLYLDLEVNRPGKAAADFARAAALRPDHPRAYFFLGQARLAAGEAKAAHTAATDFLTRVRNDPNPAALARGFQLRAAASLELGHCMDAAADAGQVIELRQDVRPEMILDLAAAWECAGDPVEALAALDQGMASLGPLLVLQQRAIEIEILRGTPDRAIVRLTQIIEATAMAAAWLEQRGRVFEHVGRDAMARRDYTRAAAELDALPVRRRNSAANTTLRRRLEASLQRVAGPHAG